MSLALTAVQFKSRQEELYARLRYEKLQQKLASMEAQYRKKMSMMNQGYEEMKQQMAHMNKEKQEMEVDIRELRDKYGQKAKEAQSLRQQIMSSSSEPYGHNSDQSAGVNALHKRYRTSPHGLQPTVRHESPSALMPRSRSPHQGRIASGHQYGQQHLQHATPSRSSPSMLVSSMHRRPESTPPRGMTVSDGGLVGLTN
jgi:hypothetical protein